MTSHEKAETLIAPTTEAAAVELFVHHGFIVPIVANDLGAGETIAVEIYTAANTWEQYKKGGTAVGLSADNNKLGFDIPGKYRLNKPVTVAAVGVLRDRS
jgi:hypothetical protein